MPRGRPKGSKNIKKEIIKVDITEETKNDENQKVEKIKPVKSLGECQLCKSNIYSYPITIRLESITGKANWHRLCKFDKLLVCNNCAKELNDVIDKFCTKKNPELKKWDIDS